MNKIVKGCILSLIIIVLLIGLYKYYINKREMELIRECIAKANEDRKKCFPGKNIFVICKIKDGEIIKESPKEILLTCGEKIMYSVNLNFVSELPESFYPCALYDKLSDVKEWRCIEQTPFSSLAKTSYFDGGKKLLTCWHKPVTNSTPLIFFYKGTVPNVSELNLLEFYVFPPTIQEISQDYFWNNLELAEKVYELHGRVVC